MKLLIIGASGQVGAALLDFCGGKPGLEAFGAARSAGDLIPLDLAVPSTVNSAFEAVRPDAAVLCSALTHVDKCEENPALAEKINAEGPRIAAECCRRFDSRLVYLSTEYVFDGVSGPYSEEDAPNPISVYGKTKLCGEKAVLGLGKAALVVRTTVVYSYNPASKNFIMQLISLLGKGEKMNVPYDQYSNPTYAPDLAGAITELLRLEKSGIYNVVGKDLLSRYDFAVRACGILGLDASLLVPRKTAELGQKAPRPLRAGLKTGKLLRETGKVPSGIDRGVERVRMLWKKEKALK